MSTNKRQVVIIKKNGDLVQKTLECEDDPILKEDTFKKIYASSNYVNLHIFNKKSFPRNTVSNCGLEYTNSSNYEAILLFGKNNGKAGQENKYEFPPPIDNELYYGNLILQKGIITNAGGDNEKTYIQDLSVDEWKEMYKKLFGGFDDCNNDDENEDDEDDEDIYVDLSTTRDGYAKDGFVVDDEDIDYDSDNQGTDESEYDENEEYYLSDEEYL